MPAAPVQSKGKRGRYRIAAPLVLFWFRFVYRNQDQLRMLDEDAYDELVAPDLAGYYSSQLMRTVISSRSELFLGPEYPNRLDPKFVWHFLGSAFFPAVSHVITRRAVREFNFHRR